MERKTVTKIAVGIAAVMLLLNGTTVALAQSEPTAEPTDTVHAAAADAQADGQEPMAPEPAFPDPSELFSAAPSQSLSPNAFDVTNWSVQNRIGVGTDAPNHRLSVIGGPVWTTNGWAGSIELANSSAIGWRANAAGQRFGIGHSGGGLTMFRTTSDPGTATGPVVHDFTVSDSGQVGIGTIVPRHQLSINGGPRWTSNNWTGSIALNNGSAIGWQANSSGARFGIGHTGGGLYFFRSLSQLGTTGSPALYDMVIRDSGKVGIGTTNPASTLHVNGTTSTNVLQILGGADLAEPFEIAHANTLQPGMVVAIDPEHAGQLRIADQAYDRTVAGVVSGAGGVQPGLVMQQEDKFGADNQHAVALTGRVYVWADARYGAIQPGDLLTTSATPGHAMRVADYDKAHGAILGKAMTELSTGKGLILMLVSLQ